MAEFVCRHPPGLAAGGATYDPAVALLNRLAPLNLELVAPCPTFALSNYLCAAFVSNFAPSRLFHTGADGGHPHCPGIQDYRRRVWQFITQPPPAFDRMAESSDMLGDALRMGDQDKDPWTGGHSAFPCTLHTEFKRRRRLDHVGAPICRPYRLNLRGVLTPFVCGSLGLGQVYTVCGERTWPYRACNSGSLSQLLGRGQRAAGSHSARR
eukprot:5456432-Amphidinium_carterae.5